MDSTLTDISAFSFSPDDFIVRLLVAIGIGALIGLEREHAALQEKSAGFAGIRTFVFVTLLGFLGAMAYQLLSPWIYLGLLLAVVLITGVSYWITATRGDIGATTEFTVLIAFLLGGLSYLGYIETSLMITVVVVVLLSSKLRLHAFIGRITAEEMYDLIRFAVVALLILPFLPDQNYGPFRVINPREIGWVVLLTSGIGFLGYILMKALGARKGILLSGIIGGLVSSTAATWIFAKKSKEQESLSPSCAVAITAASSIMYVRVLLWTFLFGPVLFRKLLPAVLLLLTGACIVTLFLYWRHQRKVNIDSEMRSGKPLDLQGALVFGLLYSLILLLVSYADAYFGNEGLLISSAIAGFSDIDAITISVSKLSASANLQTVAANAVLIAALSNTLVKLGIGLWAGSRSLRRYLFISYGFIFILGIAAIVLLHVWGR